MKKSTALLALFLVAVLTLVACGSEETSDSSGDPVKAGAEFNDADVEFTQDKIPHHEQAVQMSQMAQTHASSAVVKELGIHD